VALAVHALLRITNLVIEGDAPLSFCATLTASVDIEGKLEIAYLN